MLLTSNKYVITSLLDGSTVNVEEAALLPCLPAADISDSLKNECSPLSNENELIDDSLLDAIDASSEKSDGKKSEGRYSL